MERLVLTADERVTIDRLVDDAVGSPSPLVFAERATVMAGRLPLRLREFLSGVRAKETDIAVVSGLEPLPGLASTPTGWEVAASTGAGRREEFVLLLCGSALAEAFCWAGQQNGRLVHDICPVPGMERSLTSSSSKAMLTLHTEDVFHPCRADYVSLYCLRNPDRIGTSFARAETLELPQRMRNVLSERRFTFHSDDSHAERAGTVGSVLFGPKTRPYLRVDTDFVTAVDGDAAEALAAVRELLSSSAERVVLAPGDIVFLDNHQVVHGRQPFTPKYAGNDRWLKRLNLTRDIRRVYLTAGERSRILPSATAESSVPSLAV
jgi:TfdA family taurine catabolism dioxygenase TauD